MKKDLELPYVDAIEVAAVMKALASYRDDLTPDEAYDISYSLCDLLNVCSADEVIRFLNEKVSEAAGDDEPEDKNTKSIQDNGVVNIPSDCTNFIFNNINSKDINEDLFIFEDPYDEEAFIIVADPRPTFKVGNKKIYLKALNDEFFSLGFQNRNLNPALRRLKVMKKTFNGNASKAKFEKCWCFDERLHKDVPVVKVVFF